MPLAIWVSAVFLGALGDTAPPPTPAGPASAPAPVKDERALVLLRRMSDRLAGAKSFSFRARTSRDVLLDGRMDVTVFNDVRVAVERPDKVAATRTGDLPEFRFAYDGKSMTVYAPGNGRWATATAPSTIDAMIVAAYEQANLSFPVDELLVADPFAAITKDLTYIALVGHTTVAGHKTDHIALANPSLELQLWLDAKTALPVKEAVVYVDDPHEPHFYIEYLDWRLDPKLPPSTFALPKPAGATQVEFRAAASAAQ
ncbi:MAG TPA: DUF2092 domain-containing protein [Anaeromyxobacteraceae bacterium]|nr:DUF2092 domain-containing protein [Anaeromyxobacteraceae bacterium]